ncbi:hypothetical protein [Streptomyces sp. NPDC005485]|uniref:hypothetical protein n=1 Tax=Streptomyces sp. NPDC005485 TaxID=3155591 RepID=UPI0033BC9285
MHGLEFIALGFVFVAAGLLWRGRAVRPLSAKRARAALAREHSRHLLRAADLAIARARRSAAPDEPVIIRIDDVLATAYRQFGHPCGSREEAAAALRQRYEARGCRSDCMTDAFD